MSMDKGRLTDEPNTFAVMTCKEVGEIFKLSKNRVQQIERRALHKIREGLLREAEAAGYDLREIRAYLEAE